MAENIVFTVDLDVDKAKKKLDDFKKELKDAEKSGGSGSAIAPSTKDIDAASKAYSDLSKEIDKATKSAEKFDKAQKKAASTGPVREDTTWNKARSDAENARAQREMEAINAANEAAAKEAENSPKKGAKAAASEDVSNYSKEVSDETLVYLKQQVEDYKATLKDMSAHGLGEGYVDFDATTEALKEAQGELDAYIEKKRLLATDPESINQNDPLLQDSLDIVEEYVQELNELKDAGKGAGDAEYDEAYAGWEQAYMSLAQYSEELSSMDDGERIDALKEKLAELQEYQSGERGRAFWSGDWSGYDNATQQIEAIRAELLELGSEEEDAGEETKTLGEQIKEAFSEGFKSSKRLGASFKKFLGYAIGIRSVFSLFGKMKSAIKEGINNLVQYDSQNNQTNAVMSGFTSALATLKNALGTAFAPILSVVLPILTTFINWLSAAVSAVGQFFAALTGSGTFTRAKAITNDYAKSLKGAGGAASDLLSSLDEIHKINEGGGGGGGGQTPISDMFEEVEIDQKIADLAAKLKKLASDLVLEFKDVFFNWNSLDEESIARKLVVGLSGLAGGIIGFAIGGVGGALIGTIAGIVLGLIFNTVVFNHDGKLQKGEIVNMLIPVLTAILGGVIGAIVPGGGVGGALLGASIGFSLGLMLTVYLQSKKNAEQKALIDQFYETPAGKELLTLQSQIEERAQAIASVSVNIDAVWENEQNLKDNLALIDDIIARIKEIQGKEGELTQQEIAEMDVLMAKLRDLGITELGQYYDAFTGKISLSIAEIDKLMDKMKAQVEYEAYLENYKSAVSQRQQAEYERSGAQGEYDEASQRQREAERAAQQNRDYVEHQQELADTARNLLDTTYAYYDSSLGISEREYERRVAELEQAEQRHMQAAERAAQRQDDYDTHATQAAEATAKAEENLRKVGDALDRANGAVDFFSGKMGEAADDAKETAKQARATARELAKTAAKNLDLTATLTSINDEIPEDERKVGPLSAIVNKIIDQLRSDQKIMDFVANVTKSTDGRVPEDKILWYIAEIIASTDSIEKQEKKLAGFMAIVSTFLDSIPDENQTLENFEAIIRYWQNGLSGTPILNSEGKVVGIQNGTTVWTLNANGEIVTTSVPARAKIVDVDVNGVVTYIGTDGKTYKIDVNGYIISVEDKTGPNGTGGKGAVDVIANAKTLEDKFPRKPTVGVTAEGTSWGGTSFNRPTVYVTAKADGFNVAGSYYDRLATGGILVGGKWRSIPGYASGTMNAAQLFMARENGIPELVGRIGTNTAVMNNNQIVSSVAAGVYQATVAAFRVLRDVFIDIASMMSRIPAGLEAAAQVVATRTLGIVAGTDVPPSAFAHDDSEEIKSLLTSLIDAVKNQQVQQSVGNVYEIPVVIDGRVLYRVVKTQEQLETAITGRRG